VKLGTVAKFSNKGHIVVAASHIGRLMFSMSVK